MTYACGSGISDERASAVSGERVRTGQSARMCSSMLWDVSVLKPSPAGLGSSKWRSTKACRLKDAELRAVAGLVEVPVRHPAARVNAATRQMRRSMGAYDIRIPEHR